MAVEPFRVLYADPPWPFNDPLSGKGRGAVKNYGLLSIEEIKQFPLPLLADDSTLFLWRVASMQEEALAVMRAWGFQLKSEIVWNKRARNGKPWFGMGRTVRASHEVALIGVRGRPATLSHSVRSTFEAVVRKHSEKPDEFYTIVEQLRAGPYVELFARRRRLGWTCLGNELLEGGTDG